MKTRFFWIILVLFLAGCSSARVGTLRRSAQSVELGDIRPVLVEIVFGAGDLAVTGGAEKLLEADFIYNIDKLTPEIAYMDGALVVRQPDTKGLPILRDITKFRNEWKLRLHDEVPMDLKVNMGGGTSHLQLAGLSLTQLDVNLGAGNSTIDLRGYWQNHLDVNIDTGATAITVQLPREVGVRVEVNAGANTIKASGLRQDGNVYTNDAYGVSEVTLRIDMDAGIGQIFLEVE